MSPKPAHGSLDSLRALVQSTTSLIAQFENNLHAVALDKPLPGSSSPAPDALTPDAAAPIDALSLAHDSASLIKAHTTKLSLLIINEPFTPSAIATVLRELVAGPIPATATAVQLCTAHTHTAVVRQDLAWRCYRVLKELRALVEAIPLNGSALPSHRKNGANGEKDSIVTTGLIWAACDDLILLKSMGIAGLLVKKAEEYKDTLQDVLEELKEWSEEIEEEDEDDDDDDEQEEGDVQDITNGVQNTHLSAQQMIDDLMTPQRIPRDDPDRIRERLDTCLKRLRLTTLLYSAIIQRRLKTLPSLATGTAAPIARRLDQVYPLLKSLPHRFGEAACAFYDLDTDAIDKAMDSCFFDAFAAAQMLKVPWTGTQEDKFTVWVDKFQVGIKKPD